jgi:hypothetical protein
MNRLLITRHAPYDFDGETQKECLNETGLEACRRKLAELQTRYDIGRGAILLSSNSRRAVLTTSEIRLGLGMVSSYRSPYIQAVGIRPYPIQNLHEFTERVLAGCGVGADGRDVLLITHKPLVDAAAPRMEADGIAEVPEDWVNPKFKPDFASLANGSERMLQMWLH